MNRRLLLNTVVLLAACLFLTISASAARAQTSSSTIDDPAPAPHTVALGDTWLALSHRFDSAPQDLLAANNAINPQRQPAVGSTILLLEAASANGRLLRPFAGGTLALAASNGQNPWSITLSNELTHPYSPLLYKPLFVPGGSQPPRELPPGLDNLILAPGAVTPGSTLALRAVTAEGQAPQIALEEQSLAISQQSPGEFFALGATGAFYPPGQHLLTVRTTHNPLWEQPITIMDRDWTWEQVYFSNTAVLDPEAIRLERERLQALWDETTPEALWQGQFTPPIDDFVEISSYYGARRSVNDGPYSSYHEGTDYSAFGGSEVIAPAAGKVLLAEELAIRGGSVILDHGLGLHSGYYHLSAIHVTPGQQIEAGQLLGEVGTTGRSTGNHLHWDLLVGRTWIDPLLWLKQDLDLWLSPSPPPSPTGPGPAQ